MLNGKHKGKNAGVLKTIILKMTKKMRRNKVDDALFLYAAVQSGGIKGLSLNPIISIKIQI